MGANNGRPAHFIPLPNRHRRANISAALQRKLDKPKKLGKTLKRIIQYSNRHANKDQCKCFRELLMTWSTVELSRLVEVYESTITLHQVAQCAASARFSAKSINDALLTVFTSQTCSDLELIFLGHTYIVHRIILSTRSGYFRKLLNQNTGCTSMEIVLTNPVVDHVIFTSVLHYIYSDQSPDPEVISQGDFDVLCQQFAISKSVNYCMRYLQESADLRDLVLTFTRSPNAGLPCNEQSKLGSYPCHAAILASRSSFLKNLIARHSDAPSCGRPLEISLDDSVVSHRYALLLLKIIYQGQLDLSLVTTPNPNAASSLCEAQAISSGKTNLTLVEETMELYHIGHFLELPILTDKCEDYIVQYICPENLKMILAWSRETSGSQFVYRETLQYLEENFVQISQCPALYTLDATTLSHVLQSDFLQATEFDVLTAIINWSEHQLIRTMESREPNLVSHTTHSLARKGVKRKDMDEVELRCIAAQLMPFLRRTHLLASNTEVVSSAIKRGLINQSYVHREFAASEPVLNLNMGDAWVPGKSSTKYDIPRAYMPFYEQARSILEERTKDMSESDIIHLRRPSRPTCGLNTIHQSNHIRHSTTQNMSKFQEEVSRVPMSDESMTRVIAQTDSLLQSPIVQQALQACWDKPAVLKQVCLWAVRELGYPDQTIYTIRTSNHTPRKTADGQSQASNDLLPPCSVPDLAPECLFLRHGSAASYENLPMLQSVGLSPDVTTMSQLHRINDKSLCFPDVTMHSHSSSENDGLGAYSQESSSTLPNVGLSSSTYSIGNLPEIMSQHRELSVPTIYHPGRLEAGDTSTQHISSAVSRQMPDIGVYSVSRFPSEDRPPSRLPPDIGTSSRSGQHLDIGTSNNTVQPLDIVTLTEQCSPPDIGVVYSTNTPVVCHTLDSRINRLRGTVQESRMYYHTSHLYHTSPRPHNRDLRALASQHAVSSSPHITGGASCGPPPDVAPQPSRRRAGTRTPPPDVTSSPNNTWQAMF